MSSPNTSGHPADQAGHHGEVLSWDDLRTRALGRQFPDDSNLDPAGLLHRVGPVQSQAARAPFLGLLARQPTLTRARLTAAYDRHRIVRGSTIRGTVHTSDAETHRYLDAVTRLTQRKLWERAIPLQGDLTIEQLWEALEEHTATEWRDPQELEGVLRRTLLDAGEQDALATFDRVGTRYLTFGHGGLVRRPRTGGWSTQGRAEYASARYVLEAAPSVPEEEEAVSRLVRHHVRCHGPVSRHDIAWWSGLGLRQVDAALLSLEGDLSAAEGPLGRTYYDLKDAPPPGEVTGVRLLPEFDALLCGYDAKARERFVTAEQHHQLWNRRNGLLQPPVLVDGRITGWWTLSGKTRDRVLHLCLFNKTRRPRKAELEEPAALVSAALDVAVDRVQITRA